MKHKADIKKVKRSGFLRFIQVRRFFGERFNHVKQYTIPGIDSSPPIGARGLVESINGDVSQQAISVFIDQVAKEARRGETKLYSTSDGRTVAAFVFAKADGTLLLNGDKHGGLIKIAELTAALNAFVTAYNDHVTAKHGGDNPATLFDKTAYESTVVSHGGGT